MTALMRRGTRRRQSHDVPPGMAAFRRHRLAFLGPLPIYWSKVLFEKWWLWRYF